MSSGKPIQRPASWPGWKNRAWSLRLFGAETSKTWTPSLCAGLQESSQPVFLASPGAQPESNGEPTTTDGSGRLSFGSSWTWNPSSCFWKTSQGSFLEVDLSTSFPGLPKSGSMRTGCISRRPRLARAIGGSECSSWLTPTSKDGEKDQDGPATLEKYGQTTSSQRLRNQVLVAWPTPRSEDSESCGNHPEATDSLTGATMLWATPGAMAGGSTSRGGDRIAEPLLGGQVQLWTSPVATDRANRGNRARKNGHTGGGESSLADDVQRFGITPQSSECHANHAQDEDGFSLDLSTITPASAATAKDGAGTTDSQTAGESRGAGDLWATPMTSDDGHKVTPASKIGLLPQVASWPTPNSRDHKGSDLESRNGGSSLSHYAETGQRSHLDPATPAGPTSSETQPGLRRRLNPAFVCWLMGMPHAFWTRAEPISSGAQATALFRTAQQQRLSNLYGD